jgi:hypothetical protein
MSSPIVFTVIQPNLPIQFITGQGPYHHVIPLMQSQLISSAMLVVALSAIPVYGQQKPKITSPQKLLLNPQIIATFKSQGQVEAIPVAGLFVPDTDGLYRITTYFGRSHTTQ